MGCRFDCGFDEGGECQIQGGACIGDLCEDWERCESCKRSEECERVRT